MKTIKLKKGQLVTLAQEVLTPLNITIDDLEKAQIERVTTQSPLLQRSPDKYNYCDVILTVKEASLSKMEIRSMWDTTNSFRIRASHASIIKTN